ncbi:AMIN-like domain-containing (lipo)protein [Actinokineospora sp. G85]|uniref:AMIN-like domain-containing (lipo)protein n=1 Tax=Actinokineospora sp. G85 TaxID=3406626 RepID=UPI003C74DDDE
MTRLAAIAALLIPFAAAPAAAAAPAQACAVTWGSQPKNAAPTARGHVTDVRGAPSPCYDRLVVDLGPASGDGYRVEYVLSLTEDPTGDPVPLRGGAVLRVVAESPAYDDAGNPTYTPANRAELVDVTGWPTLRQVAWAGSFEGQTTIGVGARARLPFRAFTLTGPPRLVVDVAHQW